jgi:hypothetical protein
VNDTYTVGCAVIGADAVGFTLYLRWHFTPPKPGRHSKAGIAARYFEPREVVVKFPAHCVVEDRLREHVRVGPTESVCTGCHNRRRTEQAR